MFLDTYKLHEISKLLFDQIAAEQEKKQSEMETEKMWGTPVQYGTTMVQVRGGRRKRER